MTRKLVIEYQAPNGAWKPIQNKNIEEAINNLGTQDCPEVHRHLDEMIRIQNTEGALTYRWRVIEEKPAGRPAKRGDVVRHVQGREGVVIQSPDMYVRYITTKADSLREVGEAGGCIPKELFHVSDGAPVTGYDPS